MPTPDGDGAAGSSEPPRGDPLRAWRRADIDTALLRTFYALATTGSFTRAAEKVSRTQSAVSQQIQKLEETLGQPLFVRSRRHVALTTAGELLLGYARQVLELLDQALDKLAHPDPWGEVRFGSPEDFATFFLPDILARYLDRHPHVLLRTNCELTLRLIEGFERDAFDLVVIKQDAGHLHPGARPLWGEKLVWVGNDPRRPPAGLGGEGGMKLVLSPEPCVYRRRALRALDRAGIGWTIVYTSPSLAGAAAAVRAGLGLTVLPRNMIPPGLVPLPPDSGLPDLEETQMCLLVRAAPSAAVATFAQYIEDRLSH